MIKNLSLANHVANNLMFQTIDQRDHDRMTFPSYMHIHPCTPQKKILTAFWVPSCILGEVNGSLFSNFFGRLSLIQNMDMHITQPQVGLIHISVQYEKWQATGPLYIQEFHTAIPTATSRPFTNHTFHAFVDLTFWADLSFLVWWDQGQSRDK